MMVVLFIIMIIALTRSGMIGGTVLPPGEARGREAFADGNCNRLFKKGVGVLSFPWVEGFNEIKDDLKRESITIHYISTISVLLIDGLFKGRKEPTLFPIEQLFAIIKTTCLSWSPVSVQ